MIPGLSKVQFDSMTPLARQVLENAHQRSLEMLRKPRKKGPVKDHCHRGHKLEGDNLRVYHYPSGLTRVCVACLEIRREAARLDRNRQKAQALALLKKYGITEGLSRKAAA